jgi:FkbM family methyltransferase
MDVCTHAMLNKPSRPRATALIACVLLGSFWLGLIFSSQVRLATAKFYFRVENAWIEAWPWQHGKYAIERLAPVLCDIGVLRPVRMKVDPGISLLLDPRDLVAVNILRTKAWQPAVWDSISPVLPAGGVLLDVGAHIGYFSLKGSVKVGETGRVVAFEPNPATLTLLRENVAVNQARNVIVEPIACTDRDQTLTLYAAPAPNTGASSLSRENATESPDQQPKPVAVRGRPIDDVVRELKLGRVDAIKIDVEGAEVSVLRGAVDTLRRFHPKVVTEMIPQHLASFHTTPEDVAALMREAGYNHNKAVGDTDWEWTFLGPDNSASAIRFADEAAVGQLLRGFHAIESKAWRWTAGNFTIALRTPEPARRNGAWLSLKLAVPEVSLKTLGSITLAAKIGGVALTPETFTTPGEHEYRREAQGSALNEGMVEVDFSLDKSLPPTAADPREFGVIVMSAALVSK